MRPPAADDRSVALLGEYDFLGVAPSTFASIGRASRRLMLSVNIAPVPPKPISFAPIDPAVGEVKVASAARLPPDRGPDRGSTMPVPLDRPTRTTLSEETQVQGFSASTRTGHGAESRLASLLGDIESVSTRTLRPVRDKLDADGRARHLRPFCRHDPQRVADNHFDLMRDPHAAASIRPQPRRGTQSPRPTWGASSRSGAPSSRCKIRP